MSVYGNVSGDSIFSESTFINDEIQLKDPKPYREAYVLQELATRMTPIMLSKYVKSDHAKSLVESEIISTDALENLARGAYSDRSTELMVCHMAHENGDDRWDALVRARAEERRILNDLIRDYGMAAEPLCKQFNNDFVNKYVPPECQSQ